MASAAQHRRKAERLYAHAGSWFWGPKRRLHFMQRAISHEAKARLQERREHRGGWLW